MEKVSHEVPNSAFKVGDKLVRLHENPFREKAVFGVVDIQKSEVTGGTWYRLSHVEMLNGFDYVFADVEVSESEMLMYYKPYKK